MARRCSYLPLLVTEIQKHYNIVISEGGINGNYTFYHNGKILPAHYPLGLLYDLHNFGNNNRLWIISIKFESASSNGNGNNNNDGNDNGNDQKNPSSNPNIISSDNNSLGCINSTSKMENAYFNAIKQADYLRYGSAKRIHNMSPKDQISLWESIWTGNYQLFSSITFKISEPTDEKEKLPMRVYIPRIIKKGNNKEKEAKQGIEKKTKEKERENEEHEEYEVLQWPWEYKMFSLKDLEREIEKEAQSRNIKTNIKQIITHGIVLPREIKIIELIDKLLYPDNFLHLVVR